MKPQIVNLQNSVVEIFEELESTQTYLNQLAYLNMVTPYKTVMALKQRRGVGRGNTTWHSFEGTLTFSFAYKDDCLKTLQERTLSVICNVLQQTYSVAAFIKWPNDIYIKDYKICGILIDNINSYSIIGVGINLEGCNSSFASVGSLTGIRIESLDFIDNVITGVMNQDDALKNNYNMPSFVGFEGVLMEVETVTGQFIVLIDKDKKKHNINANEYGYDLKQNRIIKK